MHVADAGKQIADTEKDLRPSIDEFFRPAVYFRIHSLRRFYITQCTGTDM